MERQGHAPHRRAARLQRTVADVLDRGDVEVTCPVRAPKSRLRRLPAVIDSSAWLGHQIDLIGREGELLRRPRKSSCPGARTDQYMDLEMRLRIPGGDQRGRRVGHSPRRARAAGSARPGRGPRTARPGRLRRVRQPQVREVLHGDLHLDEASSGPPVLRPPAPRPPAHGRCAPSDGGRSVAAARSDHCAHRSLRPDRPLTASSPGQISGHQSEPGPGIGLDDRWRGARGCAGCRRWPAPQRRAGLAVRRRRRDTPRRTAPGCDGRQGRAPRVLRRPGRSPTRSVRDALPRDRYDGSPRQLVAAGSRSWTAMVAARSGPTPMALIRQPASSSRRST